MKGKLIVATAIVGVALALPSASSAAPFVYVASPDSDNVFQYNLGAGGLLAPLSPFTVAAGRGPDAVDVSPDARSVYVANTGDLDGEDDNDQTALECGES